MTKIMNWKCPMTAILNFAICGKTVPLTAWHRAEMDSAQKIHIKPIDEVLFLKNAYRSLSGAIFQLFVLTITHWSYIFLTLTHQYVNKSHKSIKNELHYNHDKTQQKILSYFMRYTVLYTQPTQPFLESWWTAEPRNSFRLSQLSTLVSWDS